MKSPHGHFSHRSLYHQINAVDDTREQGKEMLIEGRSELDIVVGQFVEFTIEKEGKVETVVIER
jgi:hypothetical protein